MSAKEAIEFQNTKNGRTGTISVEATVTEVDGATGLEEIEGVADVLHTVEGLMAAHGVFIIQLFAGEIDPQTFADAMNEVILAILEKVGVKCECEECQKKRFNLDDDQAVLN